MVFASLFPCVLGYRHCSGSGIQAPWTRCLFPEMTLLWPLQELKLCREMLMECCGSPSWWFYLFSLVIWEQSASKHGRPTLDHCCTVDHCGGALRERNRLWLHLPFPAAGIPFPKSVLVFSREGVSPGASLSGTYWISWSDVCNSSLLAKLPFLMVPTLSTWKELLFQGNSALECGCSY